MRHGNDLATVQAQLPQWGQRDETSSVILRALSKDFPSTTDGTGMYAAPLTRGQPPQLKANII